MELEVNGKRIKEQREKQDYTQQQLADIIGCSRSYISKIEKVSNPKISDQYLSLLAIALDCEQDYLTNRTNDPKVVLRRKLQKAKDGHFEETDEEILLQKPFIYGNLRQQLQHKISAMPESQLLYVDKFIRRLESYDVPSKDVNTCFSILERNKLKPLYSDQRITVADFLCEQFENIIFPELFVYIKDYCSKSAVRDEYIHDLKSATALFSSSFREFKRVAKKDLKINLEKLISVLPHYSSHPQPLPQPKQKSLLVHEKQRYSFNLDKILEITACTLDCVQLKTENELKSSDAFQLIDIYSALNYDEYIKICKAFHSELWGLQSIFSETIQNRVCKFLKKHKKI